MGQYQNLEDQYENGVNFDAMAENTTIKLDKKNVSRSSLQEVIGTVNTFYSPNQQQAVKTNPQLAAYVEGVGTTLEALGIDFKFFESLNEDKGIV